MSLLDDIIKAATDDAVPIGTVLRKCLVLEQLFKNEKFKIWLNKELDGYEFGDELPPYRDFNAISYGIFLGSYGRQLNNQPLSLGVMDQHDYQRMSRCPLTQPASAYEGVERVEVLVEAEIGRDPGVDRAANRLLCTYCHGLPSGCWSRRPKKRGPFHLVPVIANPTTMEIRNNLPQDQAKAWMRSCWPYSHLSPAPSTAFGAHTTPRASIVPKHNAPKAEAIHMCGMRATFSKDCATFARKLEML